MILKSKTGNFKPNFRGKASSMCLEKKIFKKLVIYLFAISNQIYHTFVFKNDYL